MTTADPDTDYQVYIESLPFDALLSIEKDIDQSRFPDRHRLVADLIEKHRKDGTIQYSQTYLDNLRYPWGVRFIRSINAFILFAAIASLLLKALSGNIRINLETVLNLTSGLALSALVVYGLFREKPWVVIMVLLSSYMGLLRVFVGSFGNHGPSLDASFIPAWELRSRYFTHFR
jgi:hypothetical protein